MMTLAPNHWFPCFFLVSTTVQKPAPLDYPQTPKALSSSPRDQLWQKPTSGRADAEEVLPVIQ
jgi:hypothetical protein